jgi:hypothetical protein
MWGPLDDRLFRHARPDELWDRPPSGRHADHSGRRTATGTILSGGFEFISSGGVDLGPTVLAGGAFIVSSGAGIAERRA